VINVLSWHLPDGTEETMKKVHENSQSMGHDLSPWPSEYEDKCYLFAHYVWYISDFIINSTCHIIQVTLGQ
jgi:hypothetical protein